MYRRRRRRKAPFATIPNALLNDKEMSAGAVALCCYLLGKSDDWKGHAKNIETRFGVKVDARRTWTVNAETCGWLRLRRVRMQDGSLNQFYEAQDVQLCPEERTNSRDLNSVPIIELADYLREDGEDDDGGGTPGKTGGIPPGQPPMAGPPMAGPPMAEPGDIPKKELPKKELPKKEGGGRALARWEKLEKDLGYDPLPSYKPFVKDAAIEACCLEYSQRWPACIPWNKHGFEQDLMKWANAFGYSGVKHLPRVLAYLKLDETKRDKNLYTGKILQQLGMGSGGPNNTRTSAAGPALNEEAALETAKARLARHRAGGGSDRDFVSIGLDIPTRIKQRAVDECPRTDYDPAKEALPAPVAKAVHIRDEVREKMITTCTDAVKKFLRENPLKGTVEMALGYLAQYPQDVREEVAIRVRGDRAFRDEVEFLKTHPKETPYRLPGGKCPGGVR